MDIVDLLIHVAPLPNGDGQRTLEERLRRVDGVIAPRFNSPHSHLLSVAYTPDKVGSQHLLHTVIAAGYQARLVGL